TLREVVSATTEASKGLEEFRRFLGKWRLLVLRHRAEDALGDALTSIDDEFAASWDGTAMLYTLGREFTTSAVSLDVKALEAQVAAIRASATVSPLNRSAT